MWIVGRVRKSTITETITSLYKLPLFANGATLKGEKRSPLILTETLLRTGALTSISPLHPVNVSPVCAVVKNGIRAALRSTSVPNASRRNGTSRNPSRRQKTNDSLLFYRHLSATRGVKLNVYAVNSVARRLLSIKVDEPTKRKTENGTHKTLLPDLRSWLQSDP